MTELVGAVECADYWSKAPTFSSSSSRRPRSIKRRINGHLPTHWPSMARSLRDLAVRFLALLPISISEIDMTT